MMNNGNGTTISAGGIMTGGSLNGQPAGFHPRGPMPMPNMGGASGLLPIREINGNKVNRKAFSKRKSSSRKRKDLDRERSDAATAPVELSYSDT